ncbi:MAG: hypothetical protein KA765_10875 [Thermoflexales bacterium]|nr:hypothetical protein [Thermoflexales bacterium]
MRVGSLLAAIVLAVLGFGLVLAAPLQLTTSADQAPNPPHDLQLTGHAGGRVQAVVLSGTLAYVGLSSEFSIIDIANPAWPVRLGSLMFEDNDYWVRDIIRKIVLTGHYAVVATEDGRVRLIDVSDPAQPVVVGEIQVTDYIIDLAADDQYVYLLGGGGTITNGLRIIDISDPAMPVLTGFFPGTYFYSYVAVSGSYAYLWEDYGKIHTLDLSDPAHPIKIGESSIAGGWVWDMVADNQAVYVVTEDSFIEPYSATLHLLNATQPATLTHISTVTLHALGAGNGYYGDLSVHGNRVYVADATLQIIDVTDPAHPIWRGEYTGPTTGAHGSISGNRAVVGVLGRGWRVLDVTDAQHPIELGAYDPPSYAVSAALSNNTLYVANGAYGLRLIDLTKPDNPAVQPVVPPRGADVVRVSDNRAYVLAHPDELRVLDVANPANPVTLKTYTYGGALLEDLQIAGAYLYVADSAYGLRVYNVSQPTAWTSIGSVAVPGAHAVAIEGTRAYVLAVDATGEALYTVDIATPSHPSITSIWRPAHGQLTAVWVANQIAYVTYRPQWYEYTGTIGLMTIDVTSAAAPQQLGERSVYAASPIDPVVSVSVSGYLAYLTQPFSGVRVLDVSSPSNPVELEQRFIPGSAWHVIVIGDRVIVSAQDGGVSVYDQRGHAAGQLLDGAHLPLALPGVKLSAGGDFSTTTNISGSFDLRSLPIGLSTITPTLDGYVFVPPPMTLQTPSAYQGTLNFVTLVAPQALTLTPGVTTTLAYTEPNGAAFEAVFPADTFTQTILITLTPTLAEGGPERWFTGHAFDLATSIGLRPDLAFSAPVTISLHYTDRDVSVVSDEAALYLAWWDGAQWIDAAATCAPASNYTRELDANTISVTVCSTGRYAFFGPTHQMRLPVIRR